jgi:hypothetical protein
MATVHANSPRDTLTRLENSHFGHFVSKQRVPKQPNRTGVFDHATPDHLFPTLFFIFPSIFIVLLGPIAISIARTLLPTMAGGR